MSSKQERFVKDFSDNLPSPAAKKYCLNKYTYLTFSTKNFQLLHIYFTRT